MSIVSEAFEKLNKLLEDYPSSIHINVYVEPEDDLEETYVDSNIPKAVSNGTQYDDQTLEDWYNFVDDVRGIVGQFGEIVNHSYSRNPDSLSEYIDFYMFDENGDRKNYVIDLRLSTHGQTPNGRDVRIRHVRNIDVNYKLEGITVNENTYYSYLQAENAVRKIIAKHL